MVLERSRTETDINVRDDDNLTPLTYAIMGSNTEFTAWLLSLDEAEVKVNLSCKKFPYAPIHTAAIMGNVACIRRFIESDKVDLDTKDYHGETALSHAARGGHIEIVKALLQSDRVNINSQSNRKNTPLSQAALFGEVEVVRFLLGTGKVNANGVDEKGRTPLHRALYKRGNKTARCLLDSGQVDASLSVEDRWGKTPLDAALRTCGQDGSITKLILDRMEGIGIDRESVLKMQCNSEAARLGVCEVAIAHRRTNTD